MKLSNLVLTKKFKITIIMINKPKLIPTSLVLLFTTFGQTLFGGSPPSSLEGYKMTIDVVESDGNEFTTSFYFLPNGVRLADDWEQGVYTWSRYGSTGTILMEQYSDGKFEILLNFSNNTLQGKETSGSTSEIVGSGTFTLENYSDDDLPYGKFFHDDFTSAAESEYIWGNYSKDGFSAKIHEGVYTMYGTMTDDGNRWGQEIGARSLLGLDKDWYVQGTAFSENGERIELSIECDMDPLFQLEVHLSTYGYGVNSSLQYERYDQGDDYDEQHLNNYDSSSNGSDSKHATFRIRNSASEKSFHIEWLDGTEWKNLNSFNWHTGTLTKEASSGWNQSSNFQFHDWESMENYYFNPQMEFGVPDSLTVNLGDYGFTSFSVIEGIPIIHPSSILGKKFTFEGLPILVLANETLTAKVQDLNTGEWKDESYVWETGDSTATLYLDGNSQEKDKVLKLTFTSNTGGTVKWENWDMENGQNILKESGTDTFSISDFTSEELPVTKGWMWFDHYPWVYSHVEGGWLYFQPSGSKLMIYSVKDEAWREMTE